MGANHRYKFSWDLIGDIENGRPNLGFTTRLEVYRLMQFTFLEVMEKHLGAEKTDEIFYEAKYLAGQEFYHHYLGEENDFHKFSSKLQILFKEMGMGILRMETVDMEHGRFIFSLSEDLDCSGLPDVGVEIFAYDEGFIAGILHSFTGDKFKVKKVDCWCTGDRTCRFTADKE